MKLHQNHRNKSWKNFRIRIAYVLIGIMLLMFGMGSDCDYEEEDTVSTTVISAPESGAWVTRAEDGRVETVYVGMELYSGDELENYSGYTVKLSFSGVGELELDYSLDTKIRIQSPSIFLFFGGVFADIYLQVEGAFSTETAYTRTYSKRTKFSVYATTDDFVSISVEPGSVVIVESTRSKDEVGYWLIEVDGDDGEYGSGMYVDIQGNPTEAPEPQSYRPVQ